MMRQLERPYSPHPRHLAERELCLGARDGMRRLCIALASAMLALVLGTSFLSAVAEFYGAFDDDEEDEEDETSDEGEDSSAAALDEMSKAELQEECDRRSIEYKKSWNKAQLRDALTAERPARPKGTATKKRPKLSRAARTIVGQLESP